MNIPYIWIVTLMIEIISAYKNAWNNIFMYLKDLDVQINYFSDKIESYSKSTIQVIIHTEFIDVEISPLKISDKKF
jgi:hypothetical protein